MRILNISSIVPLKGLRRENDIILRVQDYLKEHYNFEFIIVKALPYVPYLLSLISDKFNMYRQYQKKKKINLQGYETIICTWLLPPKRNMGINYVFIPLNWIWFNLVVDDIIGEKAKEADLLVAQILTPDTFIAYWLHKKYGTPYILNIRSIKKSWLRLPFIKRVISDSQQLVTPSPTMYRMLNNDYNIELIPHPVDEIFFQDVHKDYEKPRLVSVCRLLGLKQIDLVLRELADLKKKGYDFEYRIVGDGPEMENLKGLASKLGLNGSVYFEGYVNYKKVPAYLRRANIYIQPSYPETLGRTFLEAAASRCLIIGHERTGVDGIFEDGESAILVNTNTLSGRLEKLFKNFSKDTVLKFSSESREIVKELKWSSIGKKYDDVYSSVVRHDNLMRV